MAKLEDSTSCNVKSIFARRGTAGKFTSRLFKIQTRIRVSSYYVKSVISTDKRIGRTKRSNCKEICI